MGEAPRNDHGVRLDRVTHAILRAQSLAKLGVLHELEPEQARRRAFRSGALVDLRETRGIERRDGELPGANTPLPWSLFRPPGAGPLPLLLWLHGGGFVIGGIKSHAGACSFIAHHAQLAVLAIEYRKAPEHPFPAAVDDVLAAWRHIAARPERFNADPARLAIGGDSAGGNLATVTCLQLRDAGEFQPQLQVLLYPATDVGGSSPSTRRFAEGFLLDRKLLDWFGGHTFTPGTDLRDPRISPLHAPELSGLAPALIRTAGFDPLRDEGEAYADALRAAGVKVDYRCHEALIHNFFAMGGAIPANRAALRQLGEDLRRRLHE